MQTRDNLNLNDINGASAKPFWLNPARDKNKDLMRDSILGKKKLFYKDSNPLDPTYIVRSTSGRKQVIGDIDRNKPVHPIK